MKNQHSTNLRDDLDRAIAAIALIGEEVRHFGEEVRHLRKDLMAAEEHRRVQISGLYDELEHRTGKGRS